MTCFTVKTKNTCPDRQYASCTFYETDLPEFSKIEDDCVTLEETTEDLYTLVGEIKDRIDLSELGNECITYIEVEGKIFVKNALLAHEQKICELEELIQNQANLITTMQEAIEALQANNCP